MEIPKTMRGWHLTGYGGPEKLLWREDLPVPNPAPDEVLIRVSAASVNNTDINTRIGWYSKAVRGDTGAGAGAGFGDAAASDGAWSGAALAFPRIQGADCTGTIVAVGADVDAARRGERVLVRALQTRPGPDGRPVTWTFGADCDGGFAEFATVRADQALAVHADWTDVELGSVPCAFTTAEAMLQRIGLGAERLLITGASGGVGAAAVQLARRRGATVTAVAGSEKADAVRALGAAATLGRDDPLPAGGFDAVVDLVGGPRWPALLDALRADGRYVTAGAIAGPIVELDLRTLYLRDLALFGSTRQPDSILADVIGYIERGEIRPMVAATYPLHDLPAAQEAFLAKGFVGKIAIDVAGTAA